jgi:hypothetical protein
MPDGERIGDASDVVYAALFHASDEAKYVIGIKLASAAGSRSTASERRIDRGLLLREHQAGTDEL